MGVFDSIKKATSNIFKSPDKKKKNAGSALSSAAESAKANAALKTSSGSTGSNAALPTPSSNIKEAVGRATSTAVERTATTPGRPISTGGDSIKSNIAQAMDTAKQRTSTVSPIGRIGESNEPSIRDRFAQATETMTSKIDLSKINSKYADNSFTNAVAAFNSDKGDEIRNREERFEPLSVTGERFGTTEQSTADQALSDRGSFSSFEEQTRPQTVSETIQNAAARMEQATGQTPSAAIRPVQGAELPSGGNGNAGTDFRVHGGSSGKFGESASSTFNTGGSVNPTLGGGEGRLEEAIKAFLNPGVIRQAGNRVVQANADGSAPKGLSIGDTVVSKNMSKTVRGVNTDGSYQWFAPGEGANSLSRIDKERLPLSEQQKIDRYQRQYTQAMQRGDSRTAARAHELAEKVRQQYGYSGGTFGTGYTQTGSGSYDFDEAPGRVSDASLHPERAFARALFGTMDSQNQNEEVYALQQRNIIQKANEEMAEYNRSGKGNRKLKDVGLLDPNARASTWQSQGNAAQSTPTAGRYNGLIDDEAIRQMTPLERQTYNYLFSQHGEKRAQEYYDALAYTKLNAKAAESEAEQLQQFSREHPVLGTAVSAGLNATTGPMATAMNALQSAANASGAAPYRPVDENSALNRASMYGSQIRSNVENNIDTGNKYIDAAARFAYEGVGTGLDMAASMLTAGGFGTKAVTASMSSTSAQTTWMDSLSRGATQQQAAVNAFANGVLEFISEAPAVEGFFRIGKGTAPIKDVRTLGINLAQQMGVEAGGEGFANITQTAADQIIMGNRSSYAQTVDEYMRNGMTKEQATSQAFRDMYIVDTARAAGLGAAMGGLGGVIATGANINNTRQNMRMRAVDPDTGRTIRTYSPIAQDIAKTAQRINEDYGLPPKFVKTANAIVNGDKVGSVALANLKGAIQEQAQIQAREQIQDIYRYVGLPQESVPNRMSLALGRFTGADESGFGNRRFTQAWARKSAEIEQKLFMAYNMNPQSLADPDSAISQEMAEYMDYADMLLFSGYLSDDAEATNVVRAEVNQLTNAVEASAATMDPISADDDQVYETEEYPEEQEPVIEQAEEQPVLQEEEPETVQTQEPQPTAEVEQTETVEQEPEVTPASEQIETAPQDEVAEPVQETQEQGQEETEAPVVELQGENLSGVNTDLAGARRTPATPTGETIPTGGTTQQTATPNETIPTQGTTTTQQQTPADTTPTTDTSGGVVSGARNTVNRGVHISEVSKQNQQTRNAIDEAENYLDGNVSDYDVVSVDPDSGRVTLFEVDDFDGARIPRIINQVTVDNGEVYEDNSGGRIIPNKSDYVSDDYAGFNVQEQRDYEDRWRRSGIRYDSSRINDESYFNSKFGNVLRENEPAPTTEQTPQPVQPVQEPVTQTEEPQQEAQSNRLIRRLKVLPKGLKLNWKDAKNYQDKEYRYKNVRLVASGDTLYVRLNGTDRNNPVKQVFFEIPNYRSLTAQQIIMDLLEQADYSTSYPLGRHFDDAIKAFYKENDLHGGYTAPILRDLVTDEEVREGFKDEVLEPLSEVVEGTEKTEVDDELIEDTYQLLDDFINAYGIEDMQANTVNLMEDETMQQYVDGFEATMVDEITEDVYRQYDEYISDQSFEFNPDEITLTDKEIRNVNKAHKLVKQAVPGVGEVKSSYEKLKEYITDVQKFIVYYGIEEVSNGPLTNFANDMAYDFFLNDFRTNSGALSEQEREFLQSMKDARIHFDDDIKASYGPRTIRRDGKRGAFEEWNAFKKNITGKVKLVSKKSPGRDIDVVYANLLEEYPGMFDDNVWNTEDQFHLVMDKILELNEINREGVPFTQTWEGQAFESDPEGNRFITDELSQAIREALITGKVTTNGENEETAAQQRGNEETGERVPAEASGRSSEDQGNGTVDDRRNESGRQAAEDESAPAAEVESGREDQREPEDRSGRIAGSESNETADAENNEVDVDRYKELLPANSYTETEEYKRASNDFTDARKQSESLWEESQALEEELKQESQRKPREQWDEEDEYNSLIGRPPIILTERGQEIQDKIQENLKERLTLDQKLDDAGARMKELKRAAHQNQLQAYSLPTIRPATQTEYEGFSLEKTGTSFGDEYLERAKAGRKGAFLAEMSPREYIERCAFEIFTDATMESTIHGVVPRNVEKYTHMMAAGTKFDVPYLNYRDHGQEGRHRALAAYNMGIETIPVLIIGDPVPKQNEIRQDQERLAAENPVAEDTLPDNLDDYLLDDEFMEEANVANVEQEERELTPKERAQETARKASEKQRERIRREESNNELGRTDRELSEGTEPTGLPEDEEGRNAGRSAERNRTDSNETGSEYSTRDNRGDRELERVSVDSGNGSSESGRTDRNGEDAGTRDSEGYDSRVANARRFYIGRGRIDPATLPPAQRARNNIDAIRLYKEITEQGRQATLEEKEILASYSGWGGLTQMFVGKNQLKGEFKEMQQELKELLPKKEWDSARKSITSAYFTPYEVIENIYSVVNQLGITKSAQILEPSCGSGFFLGCMPQTLRENSAITGIELDTITGGMARLIYDDVDVRVQGFQDYKNGSPSLIIGNVPFGNIKVYDGKYKQESKHNIHDYFITKGLSMLQDGGIMAVLTTSGTMDKVSKTARSQMAAKANLIGAVRLPAGTFGATNVVTDLLIFQKKGENVNDEYGKDFLETYEDENGLTINTYFRDHPEMVLGTIESTSNQFGGTSLTVRPDGRTIADILPAIPAGIVSESAQRKAVELDKKTEKKIAPTIQKRSVIDTNERQPIGTINKVDGELYTADGDGGWVPYDPDVKAAKKKADLKERAKAMFDLLQARQDLLDLERSTEDDDVVQEAIREFERKYDGFVEKYGYIHNRNNKKAYESDSGNYSKLASMENGKQNKKGNIFFERVISPKQEITHVNSAVDALTVSLNMTGGVDLEYMSQLYGKSAEEIVKELSGRIYTDPISGQYVTTDELASGNVREKYETLTRKEDKSEEDFDAMAKLAEVMPKDLTPEEISVSLGSPWVGKEYTSEFIHDICGGSLGAYYQPASGTWYMTGWADYRKNDKYGVGKVKTDDLIEKILNKRDLVIKDADGHIDREKTNQLEVRADELRNQFELWVWKDEQRRADLLDKYNRLYNSNVNREYDGSYLELPGHNPAITLRTHQSNAVARGTQTRNSLFVHPVGSGKTFAMIATIMEMKRLGIAQKPLLVVPNAKVAEFMEDAYKLYPAAEILAIQDNDFSKQNRQEMLAKIEAGTYDMIIMRASNFDMFPLSKEYMEQYMDSELSKYRMALAESKGGEANLSSKDTNNLERSIASVEKALQEYMAKITDSSEQINIFLDQCGIDALVVDEVQNYKNLYFPTRFARVKGVTSGKPSQKCIHMHMVTQMLNQRKNHIIFASATPVTNSLSELYNMQRYLQPEVLAEYGLDSFDAWASTFSELVSAPELNSTGTKAKIVTRFSKFKNLPELGNMIMRTFDMVAKEDLQLKLPEVRRHHVTSPSGRLLDALNAAIDARMIYDPESDSIALEAFNDAKFAATDLRFVHGILVEHGFIPPNTPIEELDLPNSKVNKCVANVLEKYEETSDNDGTQVIFLDKGIPGSGKDKGKAKKYGFDLYSDIKAKLVAGGIPESEIAFIHDYNTDKKKGELSAAMNSGEIRVLIGSTEKAGVGLNIQEKLAAAHHLDAPMRPADYEQRNGRIIRQGNTNEVVDIYNYSTLNSFDAPMWQMLERKQSGINSVMSGKITSREIEDSADLSDIFTTMTIEAANNDLLFELQEVQETVRKLSSKQALFEQDKFAYQDLIANGTAAEQKILANIREAESRRDYIKENESAGFVVRGKTYDSMKEASEAAYQAFNSRSMREKYDPFVIGQINGVNIVAQAQSNLEYRGLFVVRLEGIPWTNLFYVAYRGQEEKAQATSELSFGRVDSIFQMARNRIEESKANSYIEQEQRRLEHLRERISEANEHINDTFDQEEELRQARIREKEINDEMLNAETGRAKPEIRMYYPEEFALETEAPAPVEETAPAEDQTAPAEEAVEEEPAINPETGEIIEEEPATTGEMPERLESRSGSNPQASPAVKATVRRVRQESRENQPIQVDKGTNSLPKEYLEGALSYQRARDDYGKAKEAQRSVTKQDVKATKKTGLQGIINEIMHTFDIRFSTAGRMRGRTMGYYDTPHQVIHTKFHNALGVGIHELGHHLDNLYKFSDNPAIANILKNAPGLESALDRAGYRDKAKPFETAAEFLWQYMTNPDGAYEMGSYSGTGENFYDTFESKLSKADLQRVKHIRARVFAFYGDDVSAAERMRTTTQTRKEARQKMYKGRIREYLHDVRTEVLTSLVDYTTPFRDMMNEIEDMTGKPLSQKDRLDVSLAMAGSCGTQADALIRAGGAFMNPDNTVNENFSSFGDIFASMEKEMSAIDPQWVRDFESYLKSKHSIDWENNGKQTVSRDLAHHISGSPVEDSIRFHHEVIDELDQKYGRMFAEHADMLYKWWDQFMQTWAVDSGLVDADLYEHCKELNPHYIPMTRVMDDGRMSAPGYKGDILKRAYGSSRNTYSPIESMIGMISNIVRARYENEFGKNIARLYDRQDEDIQAFMGLYVDELPSKLVASRVDMRDLKDQLAAELMIHTEENLSDDLKASLDKMDPFKKLANLADMAGVNLIDAVIDDTVMQFRPTWKGIDKDAILVKYGGKTRAFKFEDKNLQQALKALEPSAKAKAIKTVGKVTRVFSALTTASNPIFAVSNAIRDFQHGFVTDGSALYAIRWGAAVGQSFVNEFRKWRGAEQNEDYLRARAALGFGSKLYAGQGAFESYMESIGVGNRGNNPVSTAGKAGIRGLKKAFGLVEVLNGSIEMGPRLAAYNRAYKNTDPSLSEEDRFRIAAKAAREVTVDFNRRGTSTRNLASLVPFFGAGMAGIKQAQEIVASKEAWTTKKGRKRLLRALISQAIPALILAIMYGGDDDDSEEYQALNDYTRNAYWCFKIGDTWIRIPKDRELSALFGTSFQDMALAYLSDEFRDPETATDYLGYLIQQFMPPHELIGTALIDAWANRTWYGGTLVSESAKGNQFCPDYYQNVTDDDTSRIANGIAHAISKLPDDTQEFLGVLATPKGIDYVMDQMGGGLADVVLPLFTPAKGAAGVAAMLAGRFSVNENKTNKYINDAYEIKEKLDAEVEFRGEDVDPNVAAWADVFNATMATTRKENSDYKTIGDYYKEIRELSVDESLSFKERQKQINERYGKIADIATELVKAYEAGGSPKQTTYAEVQVPEDAKQAGFTEKDYIQSVESVQATLNSMPRKTNLAKQLAIASSNLTEKQKEYMSQKLLEKSYSEYGADMQELLDKGLSINTLADFDSKIKDKGYGNETRAKSLVILNGDYTDNEKDVLLRMVNSNTSSKNYDRYINAYRQAANAGVTPEQWMEVKNGIQSRYGKHPKKAQVVQAVRDMGYTGDMQTIMCRMYRTNWF